VKADGLARELGVDLATQTWHTQRRFDAGRSLFHFEHYAPVGELGCQCRELADAESIADLLTEQLKVVWITKEEDRELTRLGFRSRRRDPRAAYTAADITLVSEVSGRE
jgi:hypothetical protein